MPEDKIKTTGDEGSENLQTEGPVGERDEVKQAEERTRKLHEKAQHVNDKHDDSQTDD